MTSNRSFFNIMREDLRHKYWILALSVLGNFLCLVVFYLLAAGTERYTHDNGTSVYYQINSLQNFFDGVFIAAGGVVTIVGAVIVGLASFRYLFHKDMVDTYHSMPVKRSTIFLAGWLNGFLLWFVPFLVCAILTTILGATRMNRLLDEFHTAKVVDSYYVERVAELSTGKLVGQAVLTGLLLILVFLLIYHVILVAVMVSGNILNTIVTALTMGGAAAGLYVLFYAFASMYLDTYLARDTTLTEIAIDASPLVSPIWILLLYAQGEELAILVRCVIVGATLAILLFAIAFYAYRQRASELAEQGVNNRILRIVLRAVISVAAGLGGWLLFYSIATGVTVAWGIFGALLGVGLSYGVCNIVFSMEMRAFFREKVGMLVTAVCVVIIALAFRGDWFGYDTYLPDKERIASISLSDSVRTSDWNYLYSYNIELVDDYVCSTDPELIYDFLEGVTAESDGETSMEGIYAKVTLTNGRSYYRYYYVKDNNTQSVEAARKLLTTKGYLDTFYALHDVDSTAAKVTLYRSYDWDEENIEDAADIALLFAAYEQDLAENPESVVFHMGRIYCILDISDAEYSLEYRIDVQDGMTHTIEALRTLGYEMYADSVKVEDLSEIRINMEALVESEDSTVTVSGTITSDGSYVESVDYSGSTYVSVTDPDEMEEILADVVYVWESTYGPFGEKMPLCDVTLVSADGTTEYDAYLIDGEVAKMLVEKYS